MMKANSCRVILAKAKYLKLELEQCESLNEQYKIEFLIEVEANKEKSLSIGSASKVIDDGFLLDKFNDVSPKRKVDPSIKKIYKNIMSLVHPDKILSIQDEGMRLKYSNMCSEANNAINNMDVYVLVDIADSLGLHVDDSDFIKSELERCCSEYEHSIVSIKNTYPWIWASSKDELKRSVIMEYIEKKL